MNERLKVIRQNLKLTQKEFAEGIGIKQSSYSLIEKGQRPLADRYIKSICMAYDVNEKWLLTGEEPIFANTQLKKELMDIFCQLSEPYQRYIIKVIKELKRLLEQNS